MKADRFTIRDLNASDYSSTPSLQDERSLMQRGQQRLYVSLREAAKNRGLTSEEQKMFGMIVGTEIPTQEFVEVVLLNGREE